PLGRPRHRRQGSRNRPVISHPAVLGVVRPPPWRQAPGAAGEQRGAHHMSGPTTPTNWPLALWEAAQQTSGHDLPKLCPICPDPNGLHATVPGAAAVTVPLPPNASGPTIALPVEGTKSPATSAPRGHTTPSSARPDPR